MLNKLNFIPMVGNAEAQRRLALRRETDIRDTFMQAQSYRNTAATNRITEANDKMCQNCKLDLRPFDPIVTCKENHMFHKDCF